MSLFNRVEFGFLKTIFECVIVIVLRNFWSIIISIVIVVLLLLLLRHCYKIRLSEVFRLSLPREIKIKGIPVFITKKNRQIAYKLWVELKTRKIALYFEDDDYIKEIYDSWYESFKLIREYVKELGELSINKSIRDVSLGILNETLRPHLRKYQAAHRRWLSENLDIEEHIGLSPQEVQRKYPLYNELVEDIKKVNCQCQKYLEKLEEIFTSRRSKSLKK